MLHCRLLIDHDVLAADTYLSDSGGIARGWAYPTSQRRSRREASLSVRQLASTLTLHWNSSAQWASDKTMPYHRSSEMSVHTEYASVLLAAMMTSEPAVPPIPLAELLVRGWTQQLTNQLTVRR